MPRSLRVYMHALLQALIFWSTMCAASIDDHMIELRQIAQLAEYIGVDYPKAVQGGRVIDTNEYQEMEEFSGIILGKTSRLAESLNNFHAISYQAQSLHISIKSKQSTDIIRQLASELNQKVLALAPQLSLPSKLLTNIESQELYKTACTSCHGILGQGDGIMAAQLEPSPTDFTNKERALNRSIFGLYDTITNGIEGTAMPAFTELTEKQKWSLAFYTGSLAFQPSASSETSSIITLQQLVNYSPASLVNNLPRKYKIEIEQLRANPMPLFTKNISPLAITRKRLEEAQTAYNQRNYNKAHRLVVSAYLDGFELVESNLDARNQTLRKDIEATLIKLRHTISQPNNGSELQNVMANAFNQLDKAEKLLVSSVLSGVALFSASLVILLREGLEALLVIIALMTVLIKIDRRDTLKYVHIGWVTALLAGGGTWLAAQSLISFSGASREVMEGVAAMLAAIMLFFVGIWMHNKTHAAHWQSFIQRNINSSLQSETLWGLTALVFIAVYREVFETVLFYQSLLTQTVTPQHSYIAGGFFLGAAILFALAWILIKYSIKLPITQFFTMTTYLLLTLSFILTGKAVSALQEAAILSISPFPITFSVEWIGLNSTWQGVLSQILVLVSFVAIIFNSARNNNKIGID